MQLRSGRQDVADAPALAADAPDAGEQMMLASANRGAENGGGVRGDRHLTLGRCVLRRSQVLRGRARRSELRGGVS